MIFRSVNRAVAHVQHVLAFPSGYITGPVVVRSAWGLSAQAAGMTKLFCGNSGCRSSARPERATATPPDQPAAIPNA